MKRRAKRPLDSYRRVLVIKLGALGDFAQALRAMAEIRRAHPDAAITLLTTPPYADLARACGYFDAIDADGRPRTLWKTLAMLRRLRRGRFERVYDLQTSSRSGAYLYAFAPRLPEWSGIAPGASHRHRNPRRDSLQNLDRLWDQLAAAGVVEPLAEGLAPGPDMPWALAQAPQMADRFGIARPYALLAPGAAPGGERKRWPLDRYAELARRLEAMGLTPVVVGGEGEAAPAEAIAASARSTVSLAGRTTLVELAALGAGAALVVGNDSGPTHLASYAGAPAVVLFSAASRPDLWTPRWDRVANLQKDDLADLSVDAVTNAVRLCLGAA